MLLSPISRPGQPVNRLEYFTVLEDITLLDDADLAFHQNEFERLSRELEELMQTSQLPEAPTARNAINDLLVRIRLAQYTL
jgi:hypothetical protein